MGRKWFDKILFVLVIAASIVFTLFVGRGSLDMMIYNFAFLALMIVICIVGMALGFRKMSGLEQAFDRAAEEIDNTFNVVDSIEGSPASLPEELFEHEELDEKTTQLADQQARIDKIIGVKADVIEALKQEFANNNISVEIDETNGSLVMDSSVLFDYDETELTPEGQEVLGNVLPIYCSVLMQEEYFPYLAEIIIDGYTDSSGGYEYNLELSQRRSLAVAEYLLSICQSFLDADDQQSLKEKLTVNGHSSSNLVLDENGNEDADASRRVEVKFRLKDEEMIEELRSILDN